MSSFSIPNCSSRSQPEGAVLATVAAAPGVRRVEPWSVAAATPARADGLHIVETHADGGHGSLTLQAVPRASTFLGPRVVAGQRLGTPESDAAVVNEQAL